MDVENQLLKEYKDFIKSKVDYDCKILPKTPESLSSFPTIIFKESGNTDYSQGKTIVNMEYIDRLLYTVEIYTKDIAIGNRIIKSRQLMIELKQLTFDFFRNVGFERMSCDRGEYTDFTVDRLIIVEQGKINNWNKKII